MTHAEGLLRRAGWRRSMSSRYSLYRSQQGVVSDGLLIQRGASRWQGQLWCRQRRDHHHSICPQRGRVRLVRGLAGGLRRDWWRAGNLGLFALSWRNVYQFWLVKFAGVATDRHRQAALSSDLGKARRGGCERPRRVVEGRGRRQRLVCALRVSVSVFLVRNRHNYRPDWHTGAPPAARVVRITHCGLRAGEGRWMWWGGLRKAVDKALNEPSLVGYSSHGTPFLQYRLFGIVNLGTTAQAMSSRARYVVVGESR